MDCWRERPLSKGDLGRLIIDVEAATVSYESRYGKEYARTTETKQVDLRAPDIVVLFHAASWGHDHATHILNLSRPNKDGVLTTLINLHCHAPEWKTWYKSASFPQQRIPIDDASTVVDALVHCVDRSSGRGAVHDPDTEHRLAAEPGPFEEREGAGLGGEVHNDVGWVKAERKRRRRARARARVYEPLMTDKMIFSCESGDEGEDESGDEGEDEGGGGNEGEGV